MMMKLFRRLINAERRLAALEAASSGVIEKPNSGGGGHDIDYLFVGSQKHVPGTRTSNFLKIMLDGSGTSWVEAMPDTQDSDSVVIDVTKNRIYIHGAFAGG